MQTKLIFYYSYLSGTQSVNKDYNASLMCYLYIVYYKGITSTTKPIEVLGYMYLTDLSSGRVKDYEMRFYSSYLSPPFFFS